MTNNFKASKSGRIVSWKAIGKSEITIQTHSDATWILGINDNNKGIFSPMDDAFCDFNKLFYQFSPEVARIFKLCLCSLTMVFTEVDYHNSNIDIIKENSLENHFYTPMLYIPVKVIKMFWEDLLDLDNIDDFIERELENQDQNEYLSYGFWRKFVNKNDRVVFLETVKKSGMRDSAQFIQDQLVALGFMHINVFDSKNYNEEIWEIENDLHSYYDNDTCSCIHLMNDIFTENKCLDDSSLVSGWIGNRKSNESFPINNQTYDKCMLTYFMKYTNNEDKPLELCKVKDNMWHQYGIQLSKLSKDKGGFSSSFDECFKIFNEVMAKACLKAAKSRPSNLDMNGTFRIFNKIKKWNSTSIDNRAEVDLTTYVWTNNAFQQSSIDEKLFYTIQMLPSHLIRSNMPEKAISLLTDTNFALARVTLGITSGAIFYSQDCEELRLHCKGKGIVKFSHAVISAYAAYHRVLLEQYPPVKSRKEVVGESYSGEIGRILHRLGTDLACRSIKREAIKYYEQALVYKAAAFGMDNLSVAHTLRSIAKIQLRQYKYDMGLLTLEQALRIEKKRLGDRPLQVAKTMKSMALVYSVKGDYYKSILFYEQVLIIERENLGICKEVAETYELLGHVYSVKGHYESSLDCYQDALKVRLKIKEGNETAVADTYFLIGKMCNLLKQHERAIEYLEIALETKRKNSNEGQTSIARVLQAIGVTYYDIKNYRNALSYFEEVVAIRRSTDWQDDGDLIKSAKVFYLMADTLTELKEYDKAIDAYVRTMRILRLQFGKSHEEIVLVQQKLGHVYMKQGDVPKATKCYYDSAQMRAEIDAAKKVKKSNKNSSIRKDEKHSKISVGA